jgi:hypothetical protein
MYRQLIIIVFLLAGITTCYSQSADTVRIQSGEFKDRGAEVIVQAETEFVITAGNLEWIQDNGGYVRAFSITNISGSWTDVESNGTITFDISDEYAIGTCKVSRVDETTIILLDLISSNDDVRLQFSVNNLLKNYHD